MERNQGDLEGHPGKEEDKSKHLQRGTGDEGCNVGKVHRAGGAVNHGQTVEQDSG